MQTEGAIQPEIGRQKVERAFWVRDGRPRAEEDSHDRANVLAQRGRRGEKEATQGKAHPTQAASRDPKAGGRG